MRLQPYFIKMLVSQWLQRKSLKRRRRQPLKTLRSLGHIILLLMKSMRMTPRKKIRCLISNLRETTIYLLVQSVLPWSPPMSSLTWQRISRPNPTLPWRVQTTFRTLSQAPTIRRSWTTKCIMIILRRCLSNPRSSRRPLMVLATIRKSILIAATTTWQRLRSLLET
jgi:hypothetical protein